MQDILLKLDYWILNLINQKGSFHYGDIFFPWVTDLHKNLYFKIIIVSLVIFFLVKLYKRIGLIIFTFLLLALGVSDFSGALVKNSVLRLRPFENSEIIVTKKSPAGSKSFYSNHASNTFTLASYIGEFVPFLQIPLFTIAVIVAYSRIYNGVHYPSDVLAGTLMGLIWGFLFSYLTKKFLLFMKQRKE